MLRNVSSGGPVNECCCSKLCNSRRIRSDSFIIPAVPTAGPGFSSKDGTADGATTNGVDRGGVGGCGTATGERGAAGGVGRGAGVAITTGGVDLGGVGSCGCDTDGNKDSTPCVGCVGTSAAAFAIAAFCAAVVGLNAAVNPAEAAAGDVKGVGCVRDRLLGAVTEEREAAGEGGRGAGITIDGVDWGIGAGGRGAVS